MIWKSSAAHGRGNGVLWSGMLLSCAEANSGKGVGRMERAGQGQEVQEARAGYMSNGRYGLSNLRTCKALLAWSKGEAVAGPTSSRQSFENGPSYRWSLS